MASVNPETMDTIKSWYVDYKATHGVTPMEDMNQLAARLDLNHAHPSGIAQLFASGQARLDSLFRDGGMLKASERRLNRVLEDKANKEHNDGAAQLSLSFGSAVWAGHNLPIVLYPILVEYDADHNETDGLSHARIRISGPAQINDALIALLREYDVHISSQELLAASEHEGISLDSTAVFNALTAAVSGRIEKFTIDHTMIVGCFIRSSTLMMVDADTIVNSMAQGKTSWPLLDLLTIDTDESAPQVDNTLPPYAPYDRDPHDEIEVGDVDNETRYVAQVVNAGHSVFVNLPTARESVSHAAAIATHAAMNGKTVLYVPGVSEQKRAFLRAMRDNSMDNFVVDIAEPTLGASVDRQLINAVSYQPTSAQAHFDQLADELVGVRGRLTKYLNDLHGSSPQWGVSAYETIENLANISALPTRPSTHVRLSTETTMEIISHKDEWAQKLTRAGELGEFTVGPDDTPWYKASLYTDDEARIAYDRVVRLLDSTLPNIRKHITSISQTCGFPVPSTVREWNKQVLVLRNLRRVLDVFQPAIFERDVDAMIDATSSKVDRKAQGISMGFWERRRHAKEAKNLVRVGVHVDNLHEALIVVRKQAQQWRQFVPRGGWPVLPARLDDIIVTHEDVQRDITALASILERTRLGGDLETINFEQLESGLRELYDDKKALDNLPERSCLEVEFSSAGLDEFIADLHKRRVSAQAAPDELALACWTTVFESIVASSPVISNQDGSVLSAATERFNQVDTQHIRSVGPRVHEELMKRLSETVYKYTDEANMLHAMLSVSPSMSYEAVKTNSKVLTQASKPIVVGMPVAVASMTQPLEPLADIAILDACSHTHPLEVLSVLSRVCTVVVLAHEETISSPSVRRLISRLPHINVPTRLTRRDNRIASFLKEHGYGEIEFGLMPENYPHQVNFVHVPANGVPSASSGIVETNRQEIERIVSIVEQRAYSYEVIPQGYKLTIVCLNDTHRQRVGAELKMLAGKDGKIRRFLHHVTVIAINDVAGMDSTDVIITMGFAKTTHGRLVQQFGMLENAHGEGMLLDAIALSHSRLDVVSAFTASDMDDERLRQKGPQLLKKLLHWASHLDSQNVTPSEHEHDDVLLNDLAQRMRSRGLKVAVDYGYDHGLRIPLVVGLPGQSYTVAVCTDDKNFMSIASARQRHRFMVEDLEILGWSVMYVWSVAAFVNPEKEVDRIVAYLAHLSDNRRDASRTDEQ